MKNSTIQMLLGTLLLIPSLSFAVSGNQAGVSGIKKYACDQVINPKASTSAKRSIKEDNIIVSQYPNEQVVVEGLLHRGVGHECDYNRGNNEHCSQQVLGNGDIKMFQMSTGGEYGRQYEEALFSPGKMQLRVRYSVGYTKAIQFDAILSCREMKESATDLTRSQNMDSTSSSQSASSAQ